jgi:very-short-patch-repair endonuclease
LEEFGINFLRFSNEDVYQKIDWIIECIESWIDEYGG